MLKKKYFARLLAIALSTSMVLTFMPTTMEVYAAEEEQVEEIPEEEPEEEEAAEPEEAEAPEEEIEEVTPEADEETPEEPGYVVKAGEEAAEDGAADENADVPEEENIIEETAETEEILETEETLETEELLETEETEEEYPEFEASETTADGIRVSVSAPEGAFKKGSSLRVRKVNVEKYAETASDAVDGTINTKRSYAYDISILDENGDEQEPEDGAEVKVTFSEIEENANNMKVVHIADDGDAKEVTTDTSSDKVEAVTDGFSIFVVAFASSGITKYYTFHSDTSCGAGNNNQRNLTEILTGLGIDYSKGIGTIIPETGITVTGTGTAAIVEIMTAMTANLTVQVTNASDIQSNVTIVCNSVDGLTNATAFKHAVESIPIKVPVGSTYNVGTILLNNGIPHATNCVTGSNAVSGNTSKITVAPSGNTVAVTGVALGETTVTMDMNVNCGAYWGSIGNVSVSIKVKAMNSVTYDRGSGTSGTVPTYQVIEGPVTISSGSGLSKSGNAFIGWSTSATNHVVSYHAGDVYTGSDALKLYAVYADEIPVPDPVPEPAPVEKSSHSTPDGGGGTTKAVVPTIATDTSKAGWTTIKDTVSGTIQAAAEEAAKTGQAVQPTIPVNMNGTSEVSRELVNTISGQDVKVRFNCGSGIAVEVNGTSFTPGEITEGYYLNLTASAAGENKGETAPIKAEKLAAIGGGQDTKVVTVSTSNTDINKMMTLYVDMKNRPVGSQTTLYIELPNGSLLPLTQSFVMENGYAIFIVPQINANYAVIAG